MMLSRRGLGVLGLALMAPAAGWAQTPAVTCRTIVPGPQDAVVLAPANHTVLFEDADVRVLDVHSRPGTREAVHTHLLPSVMYFERQGAGDYDSADGSVHRSHPTDPNFKPEVRAIKPEGPHYTTNTGDVPFHAIRVEFKHPGCGLPGWKAAVARPEDGQGGTEVKPAVMFENDEVRVLDVRLAGHASENLAAGPWPGVLYVAEAEPVRVSFVRGNGPTENETLVQGAVRPVMGNVMSVENRGDGPLHLIWFELKYGGGS